MSAQTVIRFVVAGRPVAQPRVKATIRGKHAGVYTPTKTSSGKSNGVAEFKTAIRAAAKEAFAGPLLEGPLRVDIEAVFARQSSRIWKTKPMPRYRHVQRPDCDNVWKSITDSLKGIVWVDDDQVCSGHIDKWHAAGNEEPHIVVRIVTIGDGQIVLSPPKRNATVKGQEQ